MAKSIGYPSLRFASVGVPVKATRKEWNVTVRRGAGVATDYVASAYKGSDDDEAVPFPLSPADNGAYFVESSGSTLWANVLDWPIFNAGLVINIQGERDDVEEYAADDVGDEDQPFGGADVSYSYFGSLFSEQQRAEDIGNYRTSRCLRTAMPHRIYRWGRWIVVRVMTQLEGSKASILRILQNVIENNNSFHGWIGGLINFTEDKIKMQKIFTYYYEKILFLDKNIYFVNIVPLCSYILCR